MAIQRTKRQEQARKTREKILETASVLFDQKGSRNVTIEDIATAAGCSPGNIYNYFKNKEELSACILQTLDLSYGAFAKELFTDPAYVSLSAEEKLIRYFIRVQEICAEDPKKLTYSYLYNLKFPESELLRENDDRELYRIYRQLIGQVLAEEPRYAHETVDTFLQQMVLLGRGLLFNWLLEQKAGPLHEQAENLIRTYLKGMKSTGNA